MSPLNIPPNGATAEGTRQFQKKHKNFLHPDKCRQLVDLSVSAIGIGTYLGNYDVLTDQLYQEAIQTALNSGCNLIDTAINYRCQRSERVIGKALKSLVETKQIHRSQIIVATKGGFIPFDSKPVSNLKDYIQKQWIDSGIVTEKEIVSTCHCMSPAFLQNQIDQSLANMGLDTIDLYYLHNPETQLAAIEPDEFYERLYKAFCLFEENVQRGKIQYYGLATWTAFRETSDMEDAISLERVLAAAKSAGGGDHHFKAIQLPYSMAMLEAVSVHAQAFEGKNYPALPAASLHGLSVMVSAPLLQGQLLKLPLSITSKLPGGTSIAKKALQFVASTPSVTSALVGMKDKKHVEENLEVLHSQNWDLETLQNICKSLLVQK